MSMALRTVRFGLAALVGLVGITVFRFHIERHEHRPSPDLRSRLDKIRQQLSLRLLFDHGVVHLGFVAPGAFGEPPCFCPGISDQEAKKATRNRRTNCCTEWPLREAVSRLRSHEGTVITELTVRLC